jgi:tetraacyldisaccharide 4'-kinase
MRKVFLYPFYLIYGIIVSIRNTLFDLKIKKQYEFPVPVIAVGNITAGGTGKTPHAEYLISLLQKQFRIAYLSRGYKRKSKGYVLANDTSTMFDIGDEPFQIKHKFPNVPIAVCENRVKGINSMLKELKGGIDALILDDAFQHRSVRPNINVLLIDYNRPISEDQLLPLGMLREHEKAKYRANMIIYTKCPPTLQPIEQRIIKKNLDIRPYQDLFFTTIHYGEFTPAIKGVRMFSDDLKKYSVLLVTGIANPQPLANHLNTMVGDVQHLTFPDHYYFKTKDLNTMMQKFENIVSTNKLIVTTEKDMVRIMAMPDKPDHFLENLYYLPIEIKFLDKSHEQFNKKILNYVTENKSNSRLHKKQD